MKSPSRPRIPVWCIWGLVALSGLAAGPAAGHFFVVVGDRVGPSPTHAGSGWVGEAFLNLSDQAATELLSSEIYIMNRQPDFTFRTTYIDFPAGPDDFALDADLATIGDFLDDYIFDVSDPAKLNTPMGNFVLRFNGLVNVRFEDSTLGTYGLDVLLDFATQGFGAYRTRIGATNIYSLSDTRFGGPLFGENGLIQALGLFPIQITYLNRYDPNAQFNHEKVGVELYSWHPGGLPWPAGQLLNIPGFGLAAVTPPSVIYQAQDIPLPVKGDADGDLASTLGDFRAMQNCYTGAGAFALSPSCTALDFDNDGDIDGRDTLIFNGAMLGPRSYAYLKGDFDADQRIDLADYQWLQFCYRSPTAVRGGGLPPPPLPTGCSALDLEGDGDVDPLDVSLFVDVMTGP